MNSKIYQVPEVEYKALVQASACASDVVKALGMSTTGSRNFTIVRMRNAELGITFGQELNQRGGGNTRHQLTDILVKDSTYGNSTTLKKRLVDEGLLKNECAMCGCEAVWNGKPLSLQLDHINGNHTDNRLENLRLLCPNCHSQTETFTGKNKKTLTYAPKSRLCACCGAPVTQKAKLCRECANASMRRTERPTKGELEKLLGTASYVTIGKQFGVSDNTVRKWCKQCGII